jgi:hypothetical protein
VAVALAGAGQIEPALQAVADIGDRQRRAAALGKVAAALAGAGQTEPALRAVAGIDVPGQRAAALGEVAAALAGAGQTEPALQAAVSIDDPKQRARALTALLLAPVRCSSDDRAVGMRALELLLLMSNAPDYLAAFPAPLLGRLVAEGELDYRDPQPVDPAAR